MDDWSPDRFRVKVADDGGDFAGEVGDAMDDWVRPGRGPLYVRFEDGMTAWITRRRVRRIDNPTTEGGQT